MPVLRIAFRYDDRRLFARVVVLLRGGDSGHCEASVRRVGDVHECISASWVDGGVRAKRMPLPADKWRIYALPAPASAGVDWLALHDGARYDWPGLLGFVVPWVKQRLSAWFCSEACADMLGLPEPHTYDLVKLEAYCIQNGIREQ